MQKGHKSHSNLFKWGLKAGAETDPVHSQTVTNEMELILQVETTMDTSQHPQNSQNSWNCWQKPGLKHINSKHYITNIGCISLITVL